MLNTRISFSCILSASLKLNNIKINETNGTVTIESYTDWNYREDTYADVDKFASVLNRKPNIHTMIVQKNLNILDEKMSKLLYIKKFIIEIERDKVEFYLNDNQAVEEVVLNEKITQISGFARSTISKINLENVKIIGSGAFQRCRNLVSVNLSGIEAIGDYAFDNSGLSGEIDLPKLKRLCGDAFSFTDITKFVLYDDSIFDKQDEYDAQFRDWQLISNGSPFTNCVFMNNFVVKKEVQDIRPSLLFATNISFNLQITFEEGSPFTIEENYVMKGSELILVLPFKEEKSLILPQNITKISENAFTHAYNLTELTINQNFFPAKFLLKNAYHLKKIHFKSNQIHYLDTGMFANCYSLLYVTFNSRIISVGRFCFFQCFKLTYIPWIENVTQLDVYSFGSCLNLRVVNISRVNIIPAFCFHKCQGLFQAITSPNLTDLGDSAFYSCIRLKTFDLGKVSVIPVNIFAYSGLENITIPNNVLSIYPISFCNCRKLKIIISDDHPIYRVTKTEIITKDNNAVICVFGINGSRYTSSDDVNYIYSGAISYPIDPFPFYESNFNNEPSKIDILKDRAQLRMEDVLQYIPYSKGDLPYDPGITQLQFSKSILTIDTDPYKVLNVCWPSKEAMGYPAPRREIVVREGLFEKVTVPEGYIDDNLFRTEVTYGKCEYNDLRLSAPETEYPLNRFADEKVGGYGPGGFFGFGGGADLKKLKLNELILLILAIVLASILIFLIIYYYACVKKDEEAEEPEVMP